MHTYRSMSTYRLTAWIAALAILLAVLMPAVAQATAVKASGQGWLEVCTIYGVERVAVDTGPDTQGDGRNSGDMACPWCHLHVGLPVVATSTSDAPIDYGSSRVYALCEQHVPRTNICTASARPRAPPPNA